MYLCRYRLYTALLHNFLEKEAAIRRVETSQSHFISAYQLESMYRPLSSVWDKVFDSARTKLIVDVVSADLLPFVAFGIASSTVKSLVPKKDFMARAGDI